MITDREGSETVAQDTLTNKCNTKDLCSFWLENHPAQHLAGNNPIMTFNETSQFESVKRASKKKQFQFLKLKLYILEARSSSYIASGQHLELQ